MYSLLKILFVFLFISGVAVILWDNLFITIFHTILGFFFLTFFILYTFQHITKYKDSFLLKSRKKKSTWSGILYLLVFLANIISGLMIFFYTLDFVPTWSSVHFYSSFFIFGGSFLHLLTRRRKT